MKTIKLSLGVMLLSFFASCTGPAGPDGAPGQNGLNGVANITNGTITVPAANWNNSSANYWNYGVADNAIVDMNVDAVMVYVLSGGNYFALPCASLLSSGDVMSFGYQNNLVSLIYNYSSAPVNDLQFKVVVIPPAIMKNNPNLNLKDYNAVQRALSKR